MAAGLFFLSIEYRFDCRGPADTASLALPGKGWHLPVQCARFVGALFPTGNFTSLGSLAFGRHMRSALRDLVSLFAPLLASVVLHAGTIAWLDTTFGTPHRKENLQGSRAETGRKALQVVLKDSKAIQPEQDSVVGQNDARSEQSPAGLTGLPGPYYFPPQELAQKPRAATPIALDYQANLPLVDRGQIVLRLLISESGSVDRVIVEKSNLPRELEELASKAFSQARFSAGIRENRPVNSQLIVEVTFEGDEAAPSNVPPLPGK